MIYRRISVDYTSEELLMSIPVKKRSRTDHDVFEAPWKSSVEGRTCAYDMYFILYKITPFCVCHCNLILVCVVIEMY